MRLQLWKTKNRVYSGKKEKDRERRVRLTPSLRNFSLGRAKLAACLNDMDYVRLPEILANTMVSLYWYIGCDARDVEFVLGGTDHMSKTRPLLVFGQPVEVWLLDFNQVTEITMDIEGATKAADAFVDNDPYFPKSDRDQVDWSTFKSAYIKASIIIQQYKANTQDFIPDDMFFDLPGLFCEAVESKMSQNQMQNIIHLS